jgi:periplasmic protein TonB
MNSSSSSWYFLLLIVLIHLGGITYAVMASPTPTQKDIIEPSIQGVLVVPEKVEKQVTPPPPKPKPKQKHRHKHKHKPLPKAPPSERAVKTPEPEPIPVEEPVVEEKPVEPLPEAVIPPNTDAHELNNPAPAYPAMSKKLKEEGIVLLKILVTKEGRVAEVSIKNSSGFKRLDDVAIKTIKRWKFNPATQAGVAIDYWYEIDFEFNLRKK